ncbi:unnamed protein product [Sphagnum troendelagicum]
MGVNRPRNMCSNSSRSAQSGRPLALLSLVALLVLSFATVLPAVNGSFPAAAQNEAEMVVTRKLLESANPEQTRTTADSTTDVKESALSGKEADVLGSEKKNPTSNDEELFRGRFGGGRDGWGRGFGGGGYGRGRGGFGGRGRGYGDEEVAEYEAVDRMHGGKKMTQVPDDEQLYENGGGFGRGDGWDGGYGYGRGGYGWGGDGGYGGYGGYGRGYGWRGGDGRGYGWGGYREEVGIDDDVVNNNYVRHTSPHVHHRHSSAGPKTMKAHGKP